MLTAEIIWYGNENDSRRMVVVNMEIIAGGVLHNEMLVEPLATVSLEQGTWD